MWAHRRSHLHAPLVGGVDLEVVPVGRVESEEAAWLGVGVTAGAGAGARAWAKPRAKPKG